MDSRKDDKKGNILLVEDEAILALHTASILRERGYWVAHVLSGEEAVARVLSGKDTIDLVLMDINLGKGMDGTDAARAILAERDLPIVFLSSHTERSVVERTEEIGSYGYVVKNSGITVLDASIKMAFRLFEARVGIARKGMDLEAANEHLRVTVEELQAANAKLALSEDRFNKAFRLSPDSVSITRLSDGVYYDVNDGFAEMTGYSSDEVLGRSSLPGDLGIWIRAEDRDRLTRMLRETGEAIDLEAEFRRKDGAVYMGLMSARVIEVGGERCLLSITRDVTERRLAEKAMARLARIGSVVGKATQLILRETDRRRLLEGACRIAVEDGGLRMAWIGLADEGAGSVRPVASAGVVDGYLDDLGASLSGGDPRGRGPTGIAAREGRIAVCGDIETDDRMEPWRAAAAARGYRSSASFPLRVRGGGRIIGAFSFYSGEPGYFGEEETELLAQLSLDIAFALDSERSSELREDAERRLRESERLYRESFMQSTAIKLLIDPATLDLVDANFAAADFYGYPLETLKRLKITDINSAASEVIREKVDRSRSKVQNHFFFRHRLSSGELRDVEIFSSPIELDGKTLLHSIVHDVTEWLAAQRALGESERLFRTAFEAAPVGMSLTNPDGRLAKVNRAFCDMLGMRAEDIESRPYAAITHPEDLEKSDERVRSCLSGAAGSARLVKRYIHADGHPVWADVSLALIRGEDGEPKIFLTHMLDISERRRAEERLERAVAEKDILMRELQHRVKNNLGVVCGLLGLEEAKCPDQGSKLVFADARNRIGSIASVYERLYLSEDLASVDLDLYVEDLARTLYATYNLDPDRVKLVLGVERLRLDTKRTVPLGLILNELLSNALKYAYPSGKGGEVRVALSGAGGRVSLRVADDGPGIPPEHRGAETGSMGMTLVRMLSEQLEAELSIDCSAGTEVALAFDR